MPTSIGNNVLAAVDLGAGSQAVLAQAVRICCIWDKPLHLVHVIPEGVIERLMDMLDRPDREVRARALTGAGQTLERMAALAQAPPGTEIHLEIGEPRAGILGWVKRLAPTLLVVGEDAMTDPSIRADPLRSPGWSGPSTRVLLVEEGVCGQGPT